MKIFVIILVSLMISTNCAGVANVKFPACSFASVENLVKNSTLRAGLVVEDLLYLLQLIDNSQFPITEASESRTMSDLKDDKSSRELTVGSMASVLTSTITTDKMSLLESWTYTWLQSEYVAFRTVRRFNLIPKAPLDKPITFKEFVATIFPITTYIKDNRPKTINDDCINNLVVDISENYMTVDDAAIVLQNDNLGKMHAVLGL